MSGGFRVRPLQHGYWGVSAPYYSPKLIQVSRQVPGAEWSSKDRAVTGYVDAIEVVVGMLRAIKLKVDDEELRATAPGDYAHNLLASYERSRDYQKIGIDFNISRGPTGALLADDMSLGKGHQSLRAARAFKNKTLILCPAHVRGVWEREPQPPAPGERAAAKDEGGEVYKWWPEAAEQGVVGLWGVTPREINPDAMVVVCHYDIIHAWVDAIIAWGARTGILDELHTCQGASSRRSKAVRAIRDHLTVVMGLTGTPPTDYPKDFYNALDILSPGRFGPHLFGFGRRYCAGRQIDVPIPGGLTKVVWNFDGRSNEDELQRRLSWMTLRRMKSDVAKELPAKQRQIIDVEIPRAKQVIPSYDMIKKSSSMRRALDLAADAKTDHSIALVRGHLVEGKKVTVFTWRKAIAEKIVQACGDLTKAAEFVHGGVAQAKRSLRIARVQRAEGAGLLVATIDSCSSGIDLSYADVEVFAELTWRPRDLLQAEDRGHRIGRKGSILVQYIIGRGTVDELILARIIRKLDNRDKLIGQGDDNLKGDLKGNQTDDDLLAEMADSLRTMGRVGEKPQRKPRPPRVEKTT